MKNNKDTFDQLLDLMHFYQKEAEKCAKAGSYLAGCIMLGAALEASLIGMFKCSSENLGSIKSIPRYKNNQIKEFEKWTLDQLIKAANELEWLPSEVSPNKKITLEEAFKKADIGDLIKTIKEIRNLVHPGRCVRNQIDMKITSEHYESCYIFLLSAFEHFKNILS